MTLIILVLNRLSPVSSLRTAGAESGLKIPWVESSNMANWRWLGNSPQAMRERLIQSLSPQYALKKLHQAFFVNCT
jgi:hypothetical protein